MRKRICVLLAQLEEKTQNSFMRAFTKEAYAHDYDICIFLATKLTKKAISHEIQQYLHVQDCKRIIGNEPRRIYVAASAATP